VIVICSLSRSSINVCHHKDAPTTIIHNVLVNHDAAKEAITDGHRNCGCCTTVAVTIFGAMVVFFLIGRTLVSPDNTNLPAVTASFPFTFRLCDQ
jgi:hypothetical protein